MPTLAAVRRLSLALLAAFAALPAQTATHGQMVGDVQHDRAVYWTRSSTPCLVSVQYATTQNFANAVETGQRAALASRDATVRIELTGLLPDTRYYYRARRSTTTGPGGSYGQVGTFRTAPQPQQARAVSFAFSGDAQTKSQFGIYSAMLAETPEFFLSLGDFPYCDGAQSVAEYWLEHATVRDEPRLQAFCDQVPWVATWDDHEVVNNWDSATSPTLVTNGTRGFRDWFPIVDGPTEIWRQLRYGSELELFVLDTRRHRDRNADAPSPTKTLLGAQQLQWLQQALLASDATWKVVATSVPTFYGGTDSWDGYVHERQQLLDFLLDQDVHNVVFVAADQHIAAIRELRCGLLEVQTGPLAQFIGGNTHRREPEQRWHGTVRNFGVVQVTPASANAPSTLRVTFHDAGGSVLREHVATAIDDPAELIVTSDAPEAGFVLADGPHLVRDEGARATRERMHPGAYRLLSRALPDGDGAPASLDLDVPPGATLRIGLDYRDLPDSNPVLLHDSFDEPFGPPSGWDVVDLGTGGPSSWLVCDRTLTQRTNIAGPSPAYAGTLAVTGSPAWANVTFRASFYSHDNDSCGVVFRYRDPGNYYRVRFDAERQTAQLTRFLGGTPTVLAELTNQPGFAQTFWHRITVTAIGGQLRVWRNGELMFDVYDVAHAQGRVGLYAWADQWVAFDDVVVRQGDATAATRPTTFVDDFSGGTLAGYTVVDQGTVSGPSQWTVQNGQVWQLSNIEDGDGSRAGLPKLGSLLLAPSGTPADQELRVRLRNDDNDAIGVVLRYQDGQNHYRFSLDAQRHYRRLVKVVQGTWTTLWESDDDYPPDVWHELECSARGDVLRVTWNGLPLCEVRDPDLTAGRVGLYCWASTGARFDDLRVVEPPRARAVLASVGTTAQERLELCAPDSPGALYVLAIAAGTSPGFPLANLQAGDARVWPLNPDPLFYFSLQPNPLMVDFGGVLDADGRATATLHWPPIASQLLGGAPVFIGGITYDSGAGAFDELFPTVELRIPQ